jgi:hypothetical protein
MRVGVLATLVGGVGVCAATLGVWAESPTVVSDDGLEVPASIVRGVEPIFGTGLPGGESPMVLGILVIVVAVLALVSLAKMPWQSYAPNLAVLLGAAAVALLAYWADKWHQGPNAMGAVVNAREGGFAPPPTSWRFDSAFWLLGGWSALILLGSLAATLPRMSLHGGRSGRS